ncbi:hypothetical protein [Kitasatospora sp. NPDC004531]
MTEEGTRSGSMGPGGSAGCVGGGAGDEVLLLIKVSWVVGALAGLLPIGDGFDLAGWVVLNTVTIGMAGTGIVMALAVVRPWGMRATGSLVAFAAWAGSRLLGLVRSIMCGAR